MQKTGIIVLGSVAAMLPALAQASETVRLAEPDLAMEGSLMTALKNRHSTREYAAKERISPIFSGRRRASIVPTDAERRPRRSTSRKSASTS